MGRGARPFAGPFPPAVLPQGFQLYGTILVSPTDPAYWPPANRELTVTLEDVLIGHVRSEQLRVPRLAA